MVDDSLTVRETERKLLERAGYLVDDAAEDLTADGLMHTLATKWGLRSAAQSSVRENARLPPEHLSRMRGLWAMMRMWNTSRP